MDLMHLLKVCEQEQEMCRCNAHKIRAVDSSSFLSEPMFSQYYYVVFGTAGIILNSLHTQIFNSDLLPI